jgi:hypothetical protein
LGIFPTGQCVFSVSSIRNLSYTCDRRREGYKVPIISSLMFNAMFNNVSRKKYICYFLASLFNVSYEEIFDSILFVKDRISFYCYDRDSFADYICRINGEVVGVCVCVCESPYDMKRFVQHGFSMSIMTDSPYDRIIQISINNYTFSGNDSSIHCNYFGNAIDDKCFTYSIYLPFIRRKCYNYESLSDFEKAMLVFNETSSLVLDRVCDREILKDYVSCAVDVSKNEISLLYDDFVYLNEQYLYSLKEARDCFYADGVKEGSYEMAKSIAGNLLSSGVSDFTVSKCTGISFDDFLSD